MNRTRGRLLRLAVIGVLLVAGSTSVAASPASAADATFQIVNMEAGWCLDSNFDGDVYINPCQASNPYQRWFIWNGGWTKNLRTGLCLEADGYYNAPSIRTSTCPWLQNEPRQFFQHWEGGWYLRKGFTDPWNGAWYPDECVARLWGSAHDVTGVRCLNPNTPPSRETWYTIP
jgi:hypothetical protein